MGKSTISTGPCSIANCSRVRFRYPVQWSSMQITGQCLYLIVWIFDDLDIILIVCKFYTHAHTHTYIYVLYIYMCVLYILYIYSIYIICIYVDIYGLWLMPVALIWLMASTVSKRSSRRCWPCRAQRRYGGPLPAHSSSSLSSCYWMVQGTQICTSIVLVIPSS